MDIAVNLVESYLRLNGYLTLSEMEVQKKTKTGLYETLTDVDIVALRFPGQIYATDPHDKDCRMLLIDDDVLELESETIDVIIGEVKQGEAVFNPGLTRHEVLHTVLQRVEWIYATELDGVIGQLTESGVSLLPSRSGGLVRTRLVAFGRADVSNLNTISLSHIVEAMVRFMDEFDDVLRPAQFKEPAQAFLRLLAKTGFSVTKAG
jgi:hypothetical protein